MNLFERNTEPAEDGCPELHWLNDERYQLTLQILQIVLFELNLKTKERHYSDNISDLLYGDFKNRDLLLVLEEELSPFPKDRAVCRQFLRGMMSGREQMRSVVVRLKCADSGYRWHKITAMVVKDSLGNPARLFGTISNVDDEERMRKSLRYKAEYDATTGIYNKETFLCRTKMLLESDPGKSYRIIRFDIDRFKIVNDLFSMPEGDRVLRYVGQQMKELVRGGETYARLGNDVFCLCLCRNDEETLQFMQELNDRINEYPVEFNFVISAGIYRMAPYETQPINIMIDRAGLAQKTIKGSIINNFVFYEDKLGQELSREHYFIGSMNQALENKEFIVYLQPKYDMESNRVFGAEALVRWQHPRDGLIPPGEFIPLFEKNGFILKLDEYVWEETCKVLRSWLDRGIEPIPISVNVSRTHLYDTQFCDKILQLVRKYDLEPRLLELEMTESAYVENPLSLYEIMMTLQKNGFSFLMDDFGSGYSSLNMLKDIPVDVLKIDLNFLQESKHEDSGGQSGKLILEAIVHMAQSLLLPVLAEGVELKEQAEFLLNIGCKQAQGYYYSPPVPIDEFERQAFNVK